MILYVWRHIHGAIYMWCYIWRELAIMLAFWCGFDVIYKERESVLYHTTVSKHREVCCIHTGILMFVFFFIKVGSQLVQTCQARTSQAKHTTLTSRALQTSISSETRRKSRTSDRSLRRRRTKATAAKEEEEWVKEDHHGQYEGGCEGGWVAEGGWGDGV